MPTYLKIILAVLLCVAVVAVFIVTYVINKHTKEPEDCPKDDLGGCGGCMLNCSKREEGPSLPKIVKNLGEGFGSNDEETEDNSQENKKNKGE